MSERPQQPELSRSRHTPIDPQERARESTQKDAPQEDSPDAVPEENQPGHSEGDDPDKPDPERFRRRFAGEE